MSLEQLRLIDRVYIMPAELAIAGLIAPVSLELGPYTRVEVELRVNFVITTPLLLRQRW